MKRVVGLWLLAAFAMSAVAVGSASAAAPEYGRCLKYNDPAVLAGIHTLTYSNAGCTLQVVGATEKNYEWYPGFSPPKPIVKPKFTSAGGSVLLETVTAVKVTCTGEAGTGEYSGAKTVANVVLAFTGCESSAIKCQSKGQPPGTVVVGPPLSGELGVEKVGNSPLTNKIGLNLGFFEFEFECGPASGIVVGSVIHQVKANSMKLAPIEAFKQLAGEQKPDKFAGFGVDQHILEMFLGAPFQETGLALTFTQTNEEKIEVNSVV